MRSCRVCLTLEPCLRTQGAHWLLPPPTAFSICLSQVWAPPSGRCLPARELCRAGPCCHHPSFPCTPESLPLGAAGFADFLGLPPRSQADPAGGPTAELLALPPGPSTNGDQSRDTTRLGSEVPTHKRVGAPQPQVLMWGPCHPFSLYNYNPRGSSSPSHRGGDTTWVLSSRRAGAQVSVHQLRRGTRLLQCASWKPHSRVPGPSDTTPGHLCEGHWDLPQGFQ